MLFRSISGSNNVFNIQQTDTGGANAHGLTMSTTGDYNSITTQQQGTNDTTMNVSTTGSHNTITIRSSSGSISGSASAIAR